MGREDSAVNWSYRKTVWTFISTANTSDRNRTERIWCCRIWTVVTRPQNDLQILMWFCMWLVGLC